MRWSLIICTWTWTALSILVHIQKTSRKTSLFSFWQFSNLSYSLQMVQFHFVFINCDFWRAMIEELISFILKFLVVTAMSNFQYSKATYTYFRNVSQWISVYLVHTLNFVVHRPAPKNEDEMMVAIFEYIDRLFNIVRPRRVLYMAIDGVVSNFKEQRTTCSKNSFISWFIDNSVKKLW